MLADVDASHPSSGPRGARDRVRPSSRQAPMAIDSILWAMSTCLNSRGEDDGEFNQFIGSKGSPSVRRRDTNHETKKLQKSHDANAPKIEI